MILTSEICLRIEKQKDGSVIAEVMIRSGKNVSKCLSSRISPDEEEVILRQTAEGIMRKEAFRLATTSEGQQTTKETLIRTGPESWWDRRPTTTETSLPSTSAALTEGSEKPLPSRIS